MLYEATMIFNGLQGGTRSNEGCITLGPWGGSQGEDWVIMPEGGFLKKITIVHAGVIDRIRFQSDCHTGKTETSIFGGDGGNKTDMVIDVLSLPL